MPSGQRRLTFDLTLDAARAVVAALDPSLRPIRLSRLHGGSTEVYRIALERAEPLVLKLYGEEPPWLPAKEALVAGWFAEELDFPTPRWLALDESRARLPLRYALTSHLPGTMVETLKSQPGAAALYKQMGALLRRIHAIPMPAYGYVLAEGVANPRPTNADYMNLAFDQAFAMFRAAGGEEALARRLEAATADRAILAHSAGPVLCHDDFNPKNLLGACDGAASPRLTGLLDFGNARAADPLFDLAKTLMMADHHDPAIRAPLLEGYGRLDHPDPAGVLRLYTLYHRMIMWSYLNRFGERPDGLLADLRAMAA
jgi:aminoglycoside phosphotransferase (APT) family kinase protein